jgi:signal transduction histidine kinase/ActR/RegA family two-component response regulator
LLGSRGLPVGALGLSSYRGREPLPDELFETGLLRAFMSHLGIAMERALSLQRLERLNSELLKTQELLMHESRMRAVGELAAAVAHDLNNLSGVVLMSLGSIAPSSGHAVEVLTRAEGAVEAIGEMSRRLQRIARTGADPKTGAVDLKQVVEDTVALIRPLCREDSIRVDFNEVGEPALVRGDQTMVRQAVMNLVLNAREAVIDYPAELRRIEIRLQFREREIRLEVRDHGPGLPPELINQIFKPFVTTKAGHAGLGLATVQASMKHFGGTVAALNEPGGGACFRLTFEIAGATEADVFQESVKSLRRLCVLVVDDEPQFVAGVREVLMASGHEVTTAADGEEAIAKAARQDFDLVLVDLGLPKRNGLEVVRCLRGEGLSSKMVLMTGWDSESLHGDARSSFCDSILQKPFRRRDLDRMLSTLFGGASPAPGAGAARG